jgi:DNA-binding PadR family transcriptional regulator
VNEDVGRWADPPLLVMASLAEAPKHGYAITRDVADSMGVNLGAGTLYAVIARLEERGLIEALPTEDRRRPYRLTAAGVRELEAQVQHMRSVANLAAKRVHLITRPAGA